MRGGAGVGEGEGALFLLPWGGEGGGVGFRGRGGEASFLEVERGLGGGHSIPPHRLLPNSINYQIKSVLLPGA